jgi:hypothetical protein
MEQDLGGGLETFGNETDFFEDYRRVSKDYRRNEGWVQKYD